MMDKDIANVSSINDNIMEQPYNLLEENEKIAVQGLLQLMTPQVNSNKATQVKSGDILFHFTVNIENDAKLSSLTGLPNLQILNVLVELIGNHFQVHKLTIKERTIITFIRMKTGLRYIVIAHLFTSLSSQSCKLIFHDIISKLAVVLRPAIVWPTLAECVLSQMLELF